MVRTTYRVKRTGGATGVLDPKRLFRHGVGMAAVRAVAFMMTGVASS